MIDSVFKLALGAVWTAGYRPTRGEKFDLQRACGYLDHRKMNEHAAQFDGNGFDGMRDYFQMKAVEALGACGYPIAEAPTGLDLLQPRLTPRPDRPQPGDLIRLKEPWSSCECVGLQGVQGADRRGFTIANRKGGWYIGTDPERTNCVDMGNGGPSSIAYLDTRKLRATGETDRLFGWAFAFNPEAHTGVEFYLPVRVWELVMITETDWLDWEAAEEPF